MKLFFVKAILTCAAISLAIPSHAQIIVSDAILEFSNDDRLIQSIAVGNSSNQKFIEVETKTFEVKNPNTENEELIPTKIVFTVPSKFTLSPRTQKSIRFASQRRPDSEKVYKIVFDPILSKIKATEKSEINFLTSTSVMLIINPPAAKDELAWEREETKITFENIGNTNIILRQKGLCAEDIYCTISGERLWSGDQWILNLPKSLQQKDLTLEYRALGALKEVVIPYEE